MGEATAYSRGGGGGGGGGSYGLQQRWGVGEAMAYSRGGGGEPRAYSREHAMPCMVVMPVLICRKV